MIDQGALDRHAVLGEMEPLGGVASVEKVAANAVMAGCQPEYFPVVLAAVQAILDPEFNLRGVQTTDENVAPSSSSTGRWRSVSASMQAGARSVQAGRPTRP